VTTQFYDRTHVAGAQISRSGSTALQQGVRAILFAALTTTAGIADAQEAGAQQIEEIVVTRAVVPGRADGSQCAQC
jgi:hypothetical protein